MVYINGINNNGAKNINHIRREAIWNFTDNIGSHKKKDAVVIAVTSIEKNGTITTVKGNEINFTYYIKELTNLKLVSSREKTEITVGKS